MFLIYIFYITRCAAGHQKITIKNLLYALLFAVSTSGILVLTLLNREHNPTGKNWELRLGWSYEAAFLSGDRGMKGEIVQNILLFFPWVFSMPLVFKKYQRFGFLLLTALAFSTLIELTQGIFRLGLFEWDDIMHNTIGAIAGWCFYKILIHLAGLAKNLFRNNRN